MFGILNINKPAGWTSRDVVNRVQRLVRPEKAGHTGTLDPLATGVLIVAVGQATRLIQYSHRLRKEYRATFLLGRRSPTDDIEGEVELLAGAKHPTVTGIRAALAQFLGKIQQVPPAFAAVRVEGRRAYDLARQGEKVELEARPVQIYGLKIVRYDYPELVLDVVCGTGTYIRSLGRDLAEVLGTAAVMSELERVRIGPMLVSNGVNVDDLEEILPDGLLSPNSLVDSMQRMTLEDEEIEMLHNGLTVALPERPIMCAPCADCYDQENVVGLDRQGRLMSILQQTSPGLWKPKTNFPRPL